MGTVNINNNKYRSITQKCIAENECNVIKGFRFEMLFYYYF